jgi:hypothetical protein
LNNQSCCCYFWWIEYALCILYWTFFQFDPYILAGNPDISFGKCHYYCVPRLVHNVLILLTIFLVQKVIFNCASLKGLVIFLLLSRNT